jgi:hypothetical protein
MRTVEYIMSVEMGHQNIQETVAPILDIIAVTLVLCHCPEDTQERLS